MHLIFTRSTYRQLALAAALALPSLAFGQQPKTAPEGVVAAFVARAKAQGLKAADAANPVVTDSYTDANGVTHTYLQQRVNGLGVLHATGAVHTNAEGKVVAASQFFVPDAAQKAPSPTPALTPAQAVTAATVALGLPRPVALEVVVEARPADGLVFNKGGISEDNIPVRLLYEQVDGQLVLVWSVVIAALDQQHAWGARVNAQTGRLVSKEDYVVSEKAAFGQQTNHALSLQQRALAFAAAAAPAQPLASPLQTTGTARSLTVVAMPGENPVATPRTSVALSSVNRTYSPYGWMVGENLAPANFFADAFSLLSSGKYLTRGNNVAAYDDNNNVNANLLTSPNYSLSTSAPNGGANLDYDFQLVQANGARDANNVAASVTNLFYWNNVNHDVMMAHGFDEVSGNFQYKNLSGAGMGSDFVRAEAQDGSGTNNANFYSPADGTSGRMQMYLFDNLPNNKLVVNSPSAAAGSYAYSSAAFGQKVGSLCGNLVVVNDGVSADGGAHSCASPYVNATAVSGNIALIMRGGCTTSNNYTDKVKLAQMQGAIGAIIFDGAATTTTPLTPGGTDASVTIPVIGISGVAGNALKAALASGGSAAICITPGASFDGSFDSGVMSHEYGHGISNRLTGGPATVGCLNNSDGNQTMGEGWSDFFGMWMTTKPGDIGSMPRYEAAYVANQAYTLTGLGPFGISGLRHKPYTTDMSLNNYTYAQLGTGAGQFYETHDVGEVWATVLWDLNWQFIYKYGYNQNLYAATGGNNIALKLVLDGCRMQVCNPGFLDGRDAILRADTTYNGAANASLIWAVFARRGMGYSAVQGPRTGAGNAPVVTGSVAAFDVPPNATPITLSTNSGLATSSVLEAYPNPAQNLLTVRTQLGSASPIQVTVLDLLGKMVVAPTSVPVAKMQQSGIELNTTALASGLYVVRVVTTDGIYTTKVTIQH
ncbi:MAG TPA: M36 family metallopeptidase [Hymenobacter sp.]|uniref:M36 family metallopeptidase n=1 Tax=Hymenobacter sp. TaxID=1898978 RepID=UPI002D7FBAD6|nr:M36 family metallopeptidase [Hymenobacter sp.]HET9502801.1 M36 family metallopeptidase [Hymenobacter sp.]